jgi:RNA polymerase sigma factor (sigma-70 family)
MSDTRIGATEGDEEGGEGVELLVANLFRRSAGAIVAGLARRYGLERLALAEDAVQDALLEALRRWPFEGVPREPAAWLRTVAERKALDVLRRGVVLERKLADARLSAEPPAQGDRATRDDAFFDDDVLGMLFACCTPALEKEAAVALTLSVVAGFTAREIAQAFLVSEATMAQRLVRARRRLRESGARVVIPTDAEELATRLPRVLGVVYLMFNEGYVATEGDALVREDLCGEATRLALLLAEHPATTTPEVHALAALLLFQLARHASRTEGDGAPVLLESQDRSTWDRTLIAAGFKHLHQAGRGERLTSLHLQAEIASRHVMASQFDQTDWDAMLGAYDLLLELEPTLVVRVNRAVVVGQLRGAAVALEALEEAARDPSAASYRWFFAVRAHFRSLVGDLEGGREDLRRAASLTRSTPLVRWLEERHAALLDSST